MVNNLYAFVAGGLFAFITYLIVHLLITPHRDRPYVTATVYTMLFFNFLLSLRIVGVMLGMEYFPVDCSMFELICMVLMPIALNIPYTLVRQRRSSPIIVGLPIVAFLLMIVGYWVYRDDHVLMLGLAFLVTYATAFAVWFVMNIRQFQNQVYNVYSSIDYVGLLWFPQMFWTFVAWGVVFSLSVLFRSVFVNIAYYCFCFWVFANLYRFVKNQRPVDIRLLNEATPSNPKLNMFFDEVDLQYIEGADDSQSEQANEKESEYFTDDQIFSAIERCMADNKMFLQPNLTIADISERTRIPVRQLSTFLSDKLGKPFSIYVLEYRVAHVKKLLKESPDMPIDDLVLKSGFFSESTLRKLFKDQTGVSISQFVKMQRYVR